jgi:hypothetical protein
MTIRCAGRHEMEGHLRTLALAWGVAVDGTRAAHGAAVVRHRRALRVLMGAR